MAYKRKNYTGNSRNTSSRTLKGGRSVTDYARDAGNKDQFNKKGG